MNKEKEMTQIVTSAGEYLAPKIKVKELRHRSVICASNENPSLSESVDEWSE